MQVTRREFLKLSGSAAAAATIPAWNETALRERPEIRWAARTPADMPAPDLAALLLNRAAFGPRPKDVASIRGNEIDWIEAQLDYESIPDDDVTERIETELPTMKARPAVLLANENQGQVVGELRAATLYRMIFSPRLLHEVMVEFWSDHFSIYHYQNACWALKTPDDRDVIRPNALKTFKEILTASAHSPAMLNFLDNDVSTYRNPNENYAREIMELHSLGVANEGYPYTEEDVKEVARCFTGYTWYQRDNSQNRGEFYFNDDWHDNGQKAVLGDKVPASGGRLDVAQVLDILTHHEATPRFLAFKLIRRFVTDDPTGEVPELMTRVEQAYVNSDGDIKQMLRTILQSREFSQSFAGYGGRLSRPMDLVARVLRALDISPEKVGTLPGALNNIASNQGILAAMGHLPFYWTTPDGYPDTKEAWTASATMLARWNLGLAAVGVAGTNPRTRSLIEGFDPVRSAATPATAGAAVDFWTEQLLHRPVLDADRQILVDYLTAGGTEFDTLTETQRGRLPETVALILDSPYFQWR